MAFNNLLNLGKNKQNQTEAFLALEINEDYVKAAVWMVQEGQIKVIKTSEIVAIENENIESLLQSVDMAIATACQDVSFNPEKTIFGIMHDWVDQEGIVPDKKEILKYLSQKLELKPIGYVILEEALVTYLQKQQSTPPTAILIRFSQSELLLTLVELGNIVLQEKVGRSEDLVSDVNEGLKRFADADPLPSRIILYNCNTNFEEIKQRLLAFDWEKDLPFLHTPKIESLEMKQSIKAVAIAGGSEVAKSMGFAIEEEKPVEQTNEPAEEVKTQEQLPEGFVVGQQLDLEKEETKAEELESLIVTTQNEAVISSKQPNKTGIMLAKFKAFLSKIKLPKKEKQSTVSQTSESEPVIPQKKTFSFPKNFNKKRLSFALILGLFFLVLIGAAAGLFYYYWNVPEAEIKLFLYPKYIEKTVEINLAKSATALDLQNFIIPTSANQVTVTGEEVVPTTGTKKVGEKATGKILIYNKISKTRTLKKGAILTNAENLRFELAEDVTVASAISQSQDEGESIAYGKAEASVNAGGVGTEYNIAKDSVLTFKDIDKSSLSAKAVDAFSGGSSETVQVVDKKDKDKALESLQTKLLTQLNDELSKQTDKTKLAFDTGEKPEITESSFDHEVSDEATNLTVKATMKVNTLVISKTDFDYTLMQALMGSIPESFQISSDGLQQEIKNQTETKDGLKIEVNTKVKLLPKVDFDNIRRSIVGKYPNLIQSYFQGLPNFAKVEIVVRPSLPGFLGTLPRQEGKISIAVEEVK